MTYPCKMGCICFLTYKLTIFRGRYFICYFSKKIKYQNSLAKTGPSLSVGGGPIGPIGCRHYTRTEARYVWHNMSAVGKRQGPIIFFHNSHVTVAWFFSVRSGEVNLTC